MTNRQRRREARCERPDRGPSGLSLLPWLLMGLGALSHLIEGKAANPWLGALGLLAFNTLYIAIVFRAFDPPRREAPLTRVLLVALGALTFALAIGYGSGWLLLFPLLGLAVGAVVRGRKRLRLIVFPLVAAVGVVTYWRDGWDSLGVVYGTFISVMVTAAILALDETVRELRGTREELARTAVEKERLRFSRDLHDLLGHTLSVIVVKSEVVRRLAPRDLDAALAQVADIESVGRQALTEIREAVTGYREGSLATELDRARDALSSAGIEPVVRRSGPLLEPQTEALLSWVVRESATNAIRHSGAAHCEITLSGTADRVRLTVTDDGRGTAGTTTPGSGLRGLRERVAAAGGTLDSGPAPRGGFRVTAELPVEAPGPDEGEPTT
ncbi:MULTISPECIES: sensor histidine kinase [Streptomyces]|uniref:Sensor histidine kinase n=1 Tax=Streptomyces venezuelae (strain ATCC 10712 / CBS 650.69 / DSM 40230 / JCM 4526 / NBRC 13096 / PD 04745) TaxID=953739 RepID=F2RKQ2_STRVP|nr:sensor histidine kinase [Streptomyces venezuelae]APE21284.1 sensor histidine kinase [Streptomyces venezuelae]QER98676.1 sensor histidine kinase [Streptomyces venezuelae ATCC 10712]CCA55291.1 sensor histidine kinase [Streptomyces venezuelae ATCC 10712]